MTNRPSVQVRVFQDREAMSRAAAKFFAERAQEHSSTHGRFTVALSGGSTPKLLYTLLGSPPYSDSLPWQQLHFFWVDERCVSPDHPESNYKLAFDAFLSRISIPGPNIHRMRGEDYPAVAAQAYEEELRRFFGGPGVPVFDLIILGAGEDGHTASLFPGSEALREKARFVVPVMLPSPKINRITLTLPVLNHSAKVVVLVTGRAKAGVVREILEGGAPQRYPAGLVRPENGDVVWFIDRDAAAGLKGNYGEKD